MTHIHHTLAEEFPEHIEKLHNLKMNDQHFVKLHAEYDDVNEEINKAEAGLKPMSDAALEDLKKNRLRLKDEIAKLLHS